MSRQSGIGGGQIVGERERQEDAIASAALGRHGTVALVLADGMGGHAGGDVAAKLATRTVLAHLGAGSKPPAEKLHSALAAANDAINRAILSNPELDGMGCTLVAATISRGRLRWISVGDSVLFLLRGERLSRLNADHSMRSILNDLVARGQLDMADAAHDPRRNALRSAVSGQEIDLVDAPDTDIVLKDGDLVLIASDGVETLEDAEIADIAARAASHGPQRVVDVLLEEISARCTRHQDNASALAYVHADRRTTHLGVAASQRRGTTMVVAAAVVALSLWAALMYEFRAYLGIGLSQSGGPHAGIDAPPRPIPGRGLHTRPIGAAPAPAAPSTSAPLRSLSGSPKPAVVPPSDQSLLDSGPPRSDATPTPLPKPSSTAKPAPLQLKAKTKPKRQEVDDDDR